jgi:hypothetical protein
MKESKNKNHRGSASQFFVAGELCRRGHVAVVTMGNTPNTDILCSNVSGTKFVHIQVKTFVPGNRTVSVGKKSEIDSGKNFVWVLGGIPLPNSDKDFIYYVIPSSVISKEVKKAHENWMNTPGKKGQQHNDSGIRAIVLPPNKNNFSEWSIEKYKNKWEIIDNLLK